MEAKIASFGRTQSLLQMYSVLTEKNLHNRGCFGYVSVKVTSCVSTGRVSLELSHLHLKTSAVPAEDLRIREVRDAQRTPSSRS